MADGVTGRKTGRYHHSRADEKEMSLVPAHWDIIAEAVKIRNKFDPSENHTLIIGNGDVQSVADAEEKTRISGVDGVMMGGRFSEIRGCLQIIDRARSPQSRSPWQVDYLSFLNTPNF